MSIIKHCKVCGRKIELYPSEAYAGRGQFCSPKCRAKGLKLRAKEKKRIEREKQKEEKKKVEKEEEQERVQKKLATAEDGQDFGVGLGSWGAYETEEEDLEESEAKQGHFGYMPVIRRRENGLYVD